MGFTKKCLLCRYSKFEIVMKKEGYNIVKCKKCTLIFVNPRASKEKIENQYKLDSTSPSEYYTHAEKTDKEVFDKRIKIIERFAKKGKLLDVGCSVGTFLEVANKRGWEVEGIEANENSVKYCKTKGLRVRAAFFEKDTFKNNEFDVIHMGDVIEHFPDPVEAIKNSRLFLKDNGVLAIVTPNFDSFIAKLFHVKPIEHLFYFNCQTTKKILEDNGFRILLIKETTRKRDFNSLQFSTTFRSPIKNLILKLLIVTRASIIISLVLEKTAKDEIMAIGQKV